jgi:dCMP deaminase
MCSKIVINAGIVRIVCRKGYPDDLSRQLLSEAQIKIEMFAENGKTEQLILEADAK